MKLRGLVVLVVCASPLVAMAQSGVNLPPAEPYVPRLGDIMNMAQARHIKLWFAGKSANWELAGYELLQIKASLVEAASLYQGIPVTNVTTMERPVEALADAIAAKDVHRFTRAYGTLTVACNACHQSIGRSFVVLRTPDASPFSDQQFAPAKP